MSVGLEEALRIAKQNLGIMTGDQNPEVLRFESKDGFTFQLKTVKGTYAIVVDQSGNVVRALRVDNATPATYEQRTYPARPTEPQGQYQYGIDAGAATQKALDYVGGGHVEEVEPRGDGYEVEINRGMMKGKVKVFADRGGRVSGSHKRRRSDMSDFDFD